MKRNLFKIIFSFVAVFLLVGIFVSCANKKPEDTEGSQPLELEQTITDAAGNVITLDKTCLNLFYKEDYVCSFVLPKEATDSEKKVAVALKNAMRTLTGVDFKIAYDDAEIDSKQNLVLIGNTKFEESKSTYEALEARQSVIKIVGNKLVIAFSNRSGGENAVAELIKALEACEKTEVKLKLDWTFSGTSKGGIEDLPKFENTNLKTTDCGRGTTLMTSRDNSIEFFDAYCEKINSAGFDEVATREINGHKFVTYLGETEYVYAYFTKDNSSIKKLGTVKVVSGPKSSFATGDFTEGEEKYTPTVSIIGQETGINNGQGYVFLLPDGRFIVHDGGIYSAAKPIYEALKAAAPDPENIVIAAWFVSHPHGDHQWALESFLETYYGNKTVKIQRAIFNYADAKMYDITNDKNSVTVENMYKKLEQYSSDTQVIKAHTGQEYKLGSVNVEILYTMEDFLPGNLDYLNTSSMVIRITIGGQKILLLGDSTTRSAPIMENMWGSHLKSDVVQLAHHGIWPGTVSLYEKIQADVLLWPTQDSFASPMLREAGYCAVIKKALEYAEDVYVSNDTVTVIQIPFTVTNNKQSVLTRIENA